MKHVVMYSGGVCSWAAGRRVVDRYGASDVVLLFTDTSMEDPDLYRFLREGAANIGAQLVELKDGRDPWEVFKDSRYLGNTRADPCSRILKRELARSWLVSNCDPSETLVYLGMDWTEGDRIRASAAGWKPWQVLVPMADPAWGPLLDKEEMKLLVVQQGIRLPFLYSLGAPHNNCGGFCVKAGQAHFRWLLNALPDRYAFHERKEQELREYLGKNVAILRDRRGGATRPLTMREFRLSVQAGLAGDDADEWGGCGCFTQGPVE